MGRPAIDLDGQRFGKLIATNELRVRACGSGRERLCYCDCGNDTWVETAKLRAGHTQSCGCWLIEFRRLEPGRAVRNQVLDNYKRGAAKRGLTWDLSDDEFDTLTSDKCFYCQREPNTVRRARRCNGDFIYNGIDRLDNTKGYVLDNVVSCCHICNRAKSDMMLEDFMAWIKDLKGTCNECE